MYIHIHCIYMNVNLCTVYRAPFELFNMNYALSNWKFGTTLPIPEFLTFGESYKENNS